jgi:hypothetical protein
MKTRWFFVWCVTALLLHVGISHANIVNPHRTYLPFVAQSEH